MFRFNFRVSEIKSLHVLVNQDSIRHVPENWGYLSFVVLQLIFFSKKNHKLVETSDNDRLDFAIMLMQYVSVR